jgi:hypothetical protein
MTPCEVLTERLALGEPLGDVEEHVATCPACSRLIALPRLVAAAAHAAEPNPGFAIRTAAGARAMIVTRRRKRIAGNAIAAVAAVVVGVWALRTPIQPSQTLPAMHSAPAPLEPIRNTDRNLDDISLTDEEIGAELGRISDFDRAIAPSPVWSDVEAPLHGYRLIVTQGASR